MTLNTISNTLNVGVATQCSSNNWITFNQITDVPANIDAWGMYLTRCPGIPGSNDNHIIGNTISGFCSGVLTGAFDDVGNTIAANSFSNIGPGADVMPGFTCP